MRSQHGYGYGNSYSRVNPQHQSSQSAQHNYSVSNAGSGASHLPAASGRTGNYISSDYQQRDYSQPTSGSQTLGWYGNSLNRPSSGQGDIDLSGSQTGNTSRTNNQNPYDTSGLGNLAYASSLDYSQSFNESQRKDNYYGSRSQDSGATSQLSYHNPLQSLDSSFAASGGQRTSTPQSSRYTGSTNKTSTPQTTGAHNLPIPSASYPQSLVNTYSAHTQMNTAVPRSQPASTVRNSFDTSSSSNRNNTPQSAGTQSNYNYTQNVTPTPSMTSEQRPRKAPILPPASMLKNRQQPKATTVGSQNTRITQQAPMQSSLDHNAQANRAAHRTPSHQKTPSSSSQPLNHNRHPEATTTNQSYSADQARQYYPNNPGGAGVQRTSTPNYVLQAQQRRAEAQQTSARPPSPPTAPQYMTVDPSQVYNRYHEYQKQIEAADAEHARLAALKAAHDAAEAAVTLAQGMGKDNAEPVPVESQDGEEEDDEEDEAHETETQTPTAVPGPGPTASVVPPVSQTANAAASTPTNLPTEQQEDDPVVSAMEEEMRRMVEKMREYQTRYPKLFSQVWESVKKGQISQSPQPLAPGSEATAAPQAAATQAAASQPSQGIAHLAQQPAHTAPLPSPVSVSAQPPPPGAPDGQSPATAEKRSRQKGAGRPKGTPEERAALKLAKAAEKAAQKAAKKAERVAEREASKKGVNSTPSQTLNESAAQSGPTRSRIPGESPTQTRDYPPILPPKKSPEKTTPTNGQRDIPIDPILLQQSASSNQLHHGSAAPQPSPQPLSHSGSHPGPQTSPQSLSKGPTQPTPSQTAPPASNDFHNTNGLQPPPQDRPGTLWPPEYRDILATTAANVLNAIPENSGKTMHAHHVRGMLDENPSYIELCEMIEHLGFKMDRARFAKTLLMVIPNINSRPAEIPPSAYTSSSQTTAAIPPPEGPDRGTPTGPRGRGRPRRDGQPPRRHNVDPNERLFAVNVAPPQSNGTELAQARATPPQLNGVLASQSSREANGNSTGGSFGLLKPQDASFLFARGDAYKKGEQQAGPPPSENLAAPPAPDRQQQPAENSQPTPQVPPEPLTKAMAARKRTLAEIIDLTSDLATSLEDDTPRHKIRRIGEPQPDVAEHAYTSPYAPPAQFGNPPGPQFPSTLTGHTHLQSPNEAGGHPSAVGREASTIFVADNVKNPFKDFEDIVQPIDKSLALRKSRYDPKTIARDILIAASRHPAQRGLNAHLEQLKRRFTKVDNNSDLGTFRWDIVDPGGLPVGSANMPPDPVAERSKGVIIDLTSDNRSYVNTSPHSDRQPLRPTRGSSIRGRGRGRPRGRGRGGIISLTSLPTRPSGLRHSSNFQDQEDYDDELQSDKINSIAGDSTPRRPGRPRQSFPAVVITSKRGPGRPRRIDSFESSPAPGLKRGPGRPRKDKTSQSAATVTPKFTPFLCEWEGCKAELQNLDTLRRHCFTVHNKTDSSGKFRCSWAKCSHPTRTFNDEDLFREHVQHTHIVNVAWFMGDGPHGSNLGDYESDNSSYLRDAQGRQVTPSVVGQEVEGGSAKKNNKRRFDTEHPIFHEDLEISISDEASEREPSIDLEMFRRVVSTDDIIRKADRRKR